MDHGKGMIGAIIAIVSALTFTASATAATFTVTNLTDDATPGSGSLRDAITQANNAAGADVIVFTVNAHGTIDLQSALPEVTSPIQIQGPGADALTVSRDAGGSYRVFHFSGLTSVSGITIADGDTDFGGGIYAQGDLTLDHVVVRDNTASQFGGGVYSTGALTVRDSTISENSGAAFGGGGLYTNGSTVLIARSTINGNTTEDSGAGLVLGGSSNSSTVSNSTITGNVSTGPSRFAGGILMNVFSGTLTLSNTTVAANSAAAASNLYSNNSASLTVTSSILSGPAGGGTNCGVNTGQVITSGGFNIASDASCNLTQPTDQPATPPDLGPFQDNGGPTQTMAPSTGSPAIDKGSPGSDARDQRGLDRSVDMPGVTNATGGSLGVDVGAVEVQTSDVPAPTASVTTGPTGPAQQPTFGFSAANGQVQCSIDQGTPSYGPCTTVNSHTPASMLADGSWIFRVRATSISGAEATDSRSFTVDTTAPTVSIGGGPTGQTGDRTPTFSFFADETSSFDCRIVPSGGATPAFAPCSGPGQTHTPATALADGDYTFEVRATDAAGNPSTAATRSFTVDGSAPSVSASGPTGPTADSTPTFGFSSPDTVTFACRIVAAGQSAPAFSTCSGPGQTHTPGTALADGAYTFEVRATDGASNSATDSRSFTVDTTAPTVSVDSGPSGPTLDQTPTFSFSAGEPATFACRLSSGNFAPCPGPGQTFSPGALADGSYTFEVRATDAAGNVSTSSRAFKLTAASCRQALSDVIAASAAVAKAEAKLLKAKASGNAKKIKKAKKALKKAKKAEAGTRDDVSQLCVTSDG